MWEDDGGSFLGTHASPGRPGMDTDVSSAFGGLVHLQQFEIDSWDNNPYNPYREGADTCGDTCGWPLTIPGGCTFTWDGDSGFIGSDCPDGFGYPQCGHGNGEGH
eukprot:SAG22_NODE_248_length_13909_cov_141.345112_11_plen_105_part_00